MGKKIKNKNNEEKGEKTRNFLSRAEQMSD